LNWLFLMKNYFNFCFKDMEARRLKDIGVGKVLDILKLKYDFKTLELNFWIVNYWLMELLIIVCSKNGGLKLEAAQA